MADGIIHANECPTCSINVDQFVRRFLDKTTPVVTGLWLNFYVIKIIENHKSQLPGLKNLALKNTFYEELDAHLSNYLNTITRFLNHSLRYVGNYNDV